MDSTRRLGGSKWRFVAVRPVTLCRKSEGGGGSGGGAGGPRC